MSSAKETLQQASLFSVLEFREEMYFLDDLVHRVNEVRKPDETAVETASRHVIALLDTITTPVSQSNLDCFKRLRLGEV